MSRQHSSWSGAALRHQARPQAGDATQACRDGDWLTVGDMGHWDAQGRLCLVGRQNRMLVTQGNSVLLGRSPGWPEGMFSLLAGFVEPGETIEEAVAREIHEEAGVRVRDVRYIASQPWPFPSQLMIGCTSVADDPELTIDRTELEDARWFTRAELEEARAAGEAGTDLLYFPRPFAIAHHLVTWWLDK